MRVARHHRSLTSHLAHREKITPDVVALLVAEAVSQVHVAATAIEALVIPRLPPQTRGFALDILRRLEGMSMFCDEFVRDLESFMATLEAHIDHGTSVHWQGDEHHNDGGYAVTTRDPDARAFASAVLDLASLRDRLIAALSAARAVRELDRLLQA
jgi:hypothetical protein